jgi:hypothetical protein
VAIFCIVIAALEIFSFAMVVLALASALPASLPLIALR